MGQSDGRAKEGWEWRSQRQCKGRSLKVPARCKRAALPPQGFALLPVWDCACPSPSKEPLDTLLLTSPYVYRVGAVLLEAQTMINPKAHGR